MIQIRESSEGWVISVRAQPRAKKDAIVGEHNGALKVAVSAPPQDGKANLALIAVLADALGVKKRQIELLSGHASRDKQLVVLDIERATLEKRLSQSLRPPSSPER